MIWVSLEFIDLKDAEKYLRKLGLFATRKYYKLSDTDDDELFDLTLYILEERPFSGLAFLHEITFQERVKEDELPDIMSELDSKGFYQVLEWREE